MQIACAAQWARTDVETGKQAAAAAPGVQWTECFRGTY